MLRTSLRFALLSLKFLLKSVRLYLSFRPKFVMCRVISPEQAQALIGTIFGCCATSYLSAMSMLALMP
jgi:hypothetical protein